MLRRDIHGLRVPASGTQAIAIVAQPALKTAAVPGYTKSNIGLNKSYIAGWQNDPRTPSAVAVGKPRFRCPTAALPSPLEDE